MGQGYDYYDHVLTGRDTLAHVANELSAGKAIAVVIADPPDGVRLVSSHVYIAESVNFGTVRTSDSTSTFPVSVVLRNPWGREPPHSQTRFDRVVSESGRALRLPIRDGDSREGESHVLLDGGNTRGWFLPVTSIQASGRDPIPATSRAAYGG